MGLLSYLKRKKALPPKGDAASEAGDDVQRLRRRARQRLIGAVLLLTIGVIGFPLVFETRPRPIPVDIPIEIPPKDGAPALVAPPATAPRTSGSTPPAVPAAQGEVITESRADAGRELPDAAPHAVEAPAPADAGQDTAKSDAKTAPPTPSKPASQAKPALPAADGARAQALLEGKTASQADASRFVVQVGAFADPAAAHETRLKVEKLGLKTYTQIAETPNGSRIRVRVGPFATRDEADRARATVRTAGLSAVVLTL